jgi:hypothetical protein
MTNLIEFTFALFFYSPSKMSNLILWGDGVRRRGNVPMREVVQTRLWTSTVWCSKDGLVWRRFWDVGALTWHWAEEQVGYVVDDDSGRIGVHLEDGWVPLDIIIGRAWCHRAADANVHDATPILLDDGRPLEAQHLKWREGETNDEQGSIAGERWKPLRWRCGAVKCSRDYHVSNFGRIKSPRGDVTRGFAYAGRRWAAVESESGVYGGLVDVTTASGLLPPVINVPSRLAAAARCLSAGHTPADLARSENVMETTGWQYCTLVAQHMNPRDLRLLAPRLVARDLWTLLGTMQQDTEPVFGGRLTDLMEEVQQRLSSHGEFRTREFQFEQLRFARVCLVAMA